MRSSVKLYGLSHNRKTNKELYFVNTISHIGLYHVSPHSVSTELKSHPCRVRAPCSPRSHENQRWILFLFFKCIFFTFFFAIRQWVGFVLTLHLSQSLESTRRISKVSKNMQHLLLRNSCCPWVFDIINQFFRSKTGTMKYLALGKRHCLFLWYLAVLRQHCRSQRRQSYIRKCEIMGLISFPDIDFDFEDLSDNTLVILASC